MQQRVQFCRTSDSVQIAYAVHGTGYPLILVPGWVSHLELDMEVPETSAHIAGLAGEFMVVRFDKRGTGLSDRSVRDFTLDARLRDLEALADHLGLGQFALRGMSDTRWPALVSFIAYWVISLPLGWVLAHYGNLGPAGIWAARYPEDHPISGRQLCRDRRNSPGS